MVDDAIRFFDGSRYLLHAWTIMPNHVHVAFRSGDGYTLDRILKSWKRYTAREANKMLGRSGAFWQEESYDSLLHDQRDLDHVIHYIVSNPVKAGMVDWPWVTVLRTEFSFGEPLEADSSCGADF